MKNSNFTKEKLTFTLFLLLISNLFFYSRAEGAEDPSLDNKIERAYIAKDFALAARLIEQQISAPGYKINSLKHLLLAHIYSFKLNAPDKALLIYKKAHEEGKASKENLLPPIELLYIGEIYEGRKEYKEARENYQAFLDQLAGLKKTDQLSGLLAAELGDMARYQIDNLNLKAGIAGKPLLSRIKFSNHVPMAVYFAAGAFSPSIHEHAGLNGKRIADYIRQSSPGLSYMIANYALLLNAFQEFKEKLPDEYLEAYTSKNPEDFYSFYLRHLFYRQYRDDGQAEKAERIAADLKKIGEKRRIDFIIFPEKRFSSPESTFDTYKKALAEGDIETALECYVQGEGKVEEVFRAMGKELVKKIWGEMGDIQKITSDNKSAKYRSRKTMDGQEITFYIKFINNEGEWKMMPF